MLNDFVAGVLDLAERRRFWQEQHERLSHERREDERRRAEEERLRRLVQAVDAGGAQAEDDDEHAWLLVTRARAARLRATGVPQPVEERLGKLSVRRREAVHASPARFASPATPRLASPRA